MNPCVDATVDSRDVDLGYGLAILFLRKCGSVFLPRPTARVFLLGRVNPRLVALSRDWATGASCCCVAPTSFFSSPVSTLKDKV
jgi:hypothetical protein